LRFAIGFSLDQDFGDFFVASSGAQDLLTTESMGFYTALMEVKLSPELQEKLDRLASQQGRDSESLVHEAVERLVGDDEWFAKEVERGLSQIERGEVLDQAEVAARMEKRIAQSRRE
jgi:predicted transcriptional regulator